MVAETARRLRLKKYTVGAVAVVLVVAAGWWVWSHRGNGASGEGQRRDPVVSVAPHFTDTAKECPHVVTADGVGKALAGRVTLQEETAVTQVERNGKVLSCGFMAADATADYHLRVSVIDGESVTSLHEKKLGAAGPAQGLQEEKNLGAGAFSLHSFGWGQVFCQKGGALYSVQANGPTGEGPKAASEQFLADARAVAATLCA